MGTVRLYSGCSRWAAAFAASACSFVAGFAPDPSTRRHHEQSRTDRASLAVPKQLKMVDVSVGEPGPGEIRIRHQAVGLNFIDVYQRTGLYPLPMPLTLGMEAAGVVEAVGEGVTHLKAGDRAAYASQPPGSYCELRVMPAKCVCKLPDAIDFDTGAAMMLKGLTAQYLLKRTQPQGGLKDGDFVLFHAAAGGVGLIACQWARALGLQLIGTAGSDAKCALAKEHGAAHVINYAQGRLPGARQGDHRRRAA